MTTTPKIIDDAERLVRRLADELTTPQSGECLCCYLDRQLGEFGCDGTHRRSEHYRDIVAPRATALISRLRELGACCCDCELFLNGYGRLASAGPIPPCAGVRRGSTQPCRLWGKFG